jgi:hypothetical protein
VKVEPERLTDRRESRLSLLLPDGTTLTVERLRVEQPRTDAVVWFGRVPGDSSSSAIFSVVRGTVFGSVHTSRGAIYRLVPGASGTHAIEDVDGEGVPDERDPRVPASIDSAGVEVVGCGADDPRRIDVMVVYTEDARIGAGGVDAMEARRSPGARRPPAPGTAGRCRGPRAGSSAGSRAAPR